MVNQWIGLREKLQESPTFNGEIHGLIRPTISGGISGVSLRVVKCRGSSKSMGVAAKDVETWIL